MPQLDICSFIPQIFWVTVIFFFSYSLVFRIIVPSLSKLNWGRILLRNTFQKKILEGSHTLHYTNTQKQNLIQFIYSISRGTIVIPF